MSSNGKSRGKKWIWGLVGLAVVVGGAVWYFTRGDENEAQYQTAPIARGDLMQTVTATGTLNPVTNVTVGSQISGIIQKLYVDWNSPVKAGQVIAQLDPATYKANVQQAEGDLANAKANMELARIQADRAEQLFASNLISASDHDTAIASLHQAQAQVQIKEAQLANARVNLERCTIYSPVDGTVISRNVDIGQTVAASLSAPTLFMIANDLTKMQINANVSEADIGTVEEGMPVDFTVDAFPSRTFRGKVIQIRNSPTTVQNVVTYDTVVGVNNADLKLRPGMTANATIITARRDGILKIPNAALRFRMPEPSTNKSFFAKLFSGGETGGKDKAAVTNTVESARADGTNATAGAAEPPLTGNEPPEVLFRRVREMRERGESVPSEIRAKLREHFQSGVLQRSGGGGGGGSRSASQPSAYTIYVVDSGAESGGKTVAPKPVRIKTGINDGVYTEVLDGLKEGDVVVTGIRYQTQSAANDAPNPFGGFRRRR